MRNKGIGPKNKMNKNFDYALYYWTKLKLLLFILPATNFIGLGRDSSLGTDGNKDKWTG
jgi:hypothetical protein